MKPHDSSVLGRPIELTEAQWEAQKIYLYANILKAGPNRSRRRSIGATNWVCLAILVAALVAALWQH